MNDTISAKSKTVVVTGATRGIGFQTALALARAGHNLVITGRDAARTTQAVAELRELSGGGVTSVAAELGSIQGVRDAAQALAQHCPRVDVLINNAGVLATEQSFSEDGVETNFAVNAFAPYLLTRALLPKLKPPARIINVTGGLPLYGLHADGVNPAHDFKGLVTYSRSKRALEALSLELAEQLTPQGVNVLIVSPGFAATEMSRGITLGSLPKWFWPLFPVFSLVRRSDSPKSAEKASRVCVWAATHAELPTGTAFASPGKALTLHASVRDPVRRARLRGYVDAVARRA